jgi:MATE family multidrug resistance protein
MIPRDDLRATLRMAIPVVTTQLGYMAMNTVDTLMVGRLGAGALSAVALGNGLSVFVQLISMGTLLGLDPIVSQAYGAQRWTECGRAMRHGLLLAALLSVPSMLILSQAHFILSLLKQDPVNVDNAARFVQVLNLGTPAFLAFAVLRSFLQGLGSVKPAMLVVLLANLVNFAANWVLVFGHWGAPALGIVGSAWATALSRWAMLAAFAAYVFGKHRWRRFGVIAARGRIDGRLLRRLLQLGAPVGTQYGMEIGVFTATLMMMGWLGSVPLAGHQIALTLASITFMVPLGFSATAAVRVGQALGRDDVHGARRAALAAYACGLVFMATSGLTFALFPAALARLFTQDPEVVRMGAALLMVGAAFQIFDGGQTIGIGALRGAADTRVPMLVTIVSYWGVGLPLGWLLAFRLGAGPRGLWWGLSAGLACVAVALALRFDRRVRPERLAVLRAS